MTRLITPIQHDWIRYFLLYKDELIKIDEPDNWQTANKEFLRSNQYHGFTIKISDSINFTGETATFLEDIYNELKSSATVFIITEQKNDETDDWEQTYSGQLDFTTASFGYNKFLCKVNSGDIEKKFTSRWRTELNILNNIDLDGNKLNLEAVNKERIELGNRGLKGINLLDIGTEYSTKMAHSSNSNGIKKVILLTKLSDTFYNLPQPYEVASETFPIRDIFDPERAGIDNIFFYQRQKGNVNITFKINYESVITTGIVATSILSLVLAEYEVNDSDETIEITFDLVEKTILKEESYNQLSEGLFKYKKDFNKSVANNRVFVLYHGVIDEFSSGIGTEILVKKASIDIQGDTASSATQNDVFMPFDFFERHIKLMGGNILKSSYLEKCRYSLATGFMVRNVPQVDGKETPVSITFQKLYNSFDSITPIGMSINRQTVQIERREYFYQNFMSYDFRNEIDDIDISFDKETAYSEVNIGFSTSNFSKEDALDEFNVRTVFTSPINKYRKRYNAVSDIQASSYVIEKLRRIQFDENIDRTESRRGDTTMFFIDLEDNEFVIRKYSTDFTGIPLNLYKQNDAYNFRFSPMNRLRTQGAWINPGLSKFKDKEFIFSSSTGNTSMITTPKGEAPYAENDNLPILEAGRPRFLNDQATFRIKPINLNKILNEEINGVKKMYGIFGFRYRGRNMLGYLLSYKPETDEVKLQLIQT